ncbi:MAG: hypothetical protein C0605_16225 [Hyphomicrobiales bacterium]|nr:MAG: hypothetical protein C0605_16225 [Hyphomicrobiales bacterium]
MPQSLDPLIRDMLHWIHAAPRGYDEVMAQWRTSCPQLTVWEDAVDRGLVERVQIDSRPMVRISADGRKFLGRG